MVIKNVSVPIKYPCKIRLPWSWYTETNQRNVMAKLLSILVASSVKSWAKAFACMDVESIGVDLRF